MTSESKVETLSSQQLLCGEGPVWDSNREVLYWTEALGDSIYSYNQKKDETDLHYQGLTAASLALHENGGLVATGKDGFSLLSPDKSIRVFDNVVDNIHVSHLNDIIADPMGRVFGGQEAFVENKVYEPGYLFRLDNNGEIKIVADGLHLANGMGFSPDGRTFYLVDTIPGIIYRFDYNAATGDISNKKVLVKFDKSHGIPDGMTVDKEGFIWVAMFFGGKVIRLNPDGDIAYEIRLPYMQPTSVTFGGKNLNKLFITTAGLEWRTATYAPEGHNYELPKGGSVLVIDTDFEGREEFSAKV